MQASILQSLHPAIHMLRRDMFAQVREHHGDVLPHIGLPGVPEIRRAPVDIRSQQTEDGETRLGAYLWFLMVALSALRPPSPPFS